MAVKKVIELESNINQISEDVQGLASSFEDVADSINDVEKEINDTKKSVEEIGKTSKGAKKGIEGIAKGFKGVGLAIKAAGIGLVLSLFGALKEVMMQNQVIADGFSKVFETISIVFNLIVNSLIDAVTYTSEATNGFEALGKVLGGILTITLTPLKITFYAIKGAILEAQLAWEKSMFGGNDPEQMVDLQERIAKTNEALKQTGKDAIQAGKDIAENMVEAMGEAAALVEETADQIAKAAKKSGDAWKDAGNIVELRKSLEIARAENEKLIEQSDVLAEKQRQIRDDERIGISERIAANDKLGEILLEQNKKMKENAQIAVQLAQFEYDKNRSTENAVALSRANNELLAIEAKVTGLQSEQLINQMQLEKEKNEIKQTGVDAEIESVKILNEARLSLYDNELDRMDAEREAREAEFSRQEEDIQERLDKMVTDGQTETQIYADLLAQKKVLQADYDAYIITSTKERARKQLEQEEAVQAAKIGLAKDGFKLLEVMANQGSDLQKSLAAAGIITSTYEAIMNAYTTAQKSPLTTIFPAYPYIQAGLAGAFGAVQLNNLNSGQPPSGSVGGSGGSAAGSIVRPDINVVQASDANNSLRDINASSNQPMRAYVTSSDVATAEALERNTVNKAKLGG